MQNCEPLPSHAIYGGDPVVMPVVEARASQSPVSTMNRAHLPVARTKPSGKRNTRLPTQAGLLAWAFSCSPSHHLISDSGIVSTKVNPLQRRVRVGFSPNFPSSRFLPRRASAACVTLINIQDVSRISRRYVMTVIPPPNEAPHFRQSWGNHYFRVYSDIGGLIWSFFHG